MEGRWSYYCRILRHSATYSVSYLTEFELRNKKMAEAGKNEAETDLSELLDSALADFGRTLNTDDELDSMMDSMDQQAVQKAAQKFDNVMKTFQSSSNHPNANSSETVEMTADERLAAENFQNMLKALVEAEQKALNEHPLDEDGQDNYDRDGAETFIEQLKKLAEQDPANITDESHYKTLMNLVQAFFSKDLMYPPLKQLLEKFPIYIAEHSELDADTKARYEKQMNVIERVCMEYEKDESEDVEEMKRRFDIITTLMMELQSYGYPPGELVGEAPAGWTTDPETGLPKVDDVSKAAEACSFIEKQW
ncbi:putative peroxisomal biogenesis factor [Dirofilaria immitis]